MSVIGCSVAQGGGEVLTAPASAVLVWRKVYGCRVFMGGCLASLEGSISQVEAAAAAAATAGRCGEVAAAPQGVGEV